MLVKRQWGSELDPEALARAHKPVDLDAEVADCPACGAKFKPPVRRCPDCGLRFG